MPTSDRDGVLVAVISGELDMVSVDAIGTALFDHLDEQPNGLVVELAVYFMGSSALSMLPELRGRAQSKDVGLAIVAAQAAAVRPMMASALSQVLPVSHSVEEASKSIHREPAAGRQSVWRPRGQLPSRNRNAARWGVDAFSRAGRVRSAGPR
ncbi:STAS domain-containing protein [Lentzea sp. NPDC102401]|uniref:STAS domain-containing protein n=1 Tax=Lentzea sp. NPDC102401 TaxID=3364128 RepID=UPI0038198D6C